MDVETAVSVPRANHGRSDKAVKNFSCRRNNAKTLVVKMHKPSKKRLRVYRLNARPMFMDRNDACD
ncbi:hypothetical protein SBC2_85100 (plasmid) [Caballeronia sp. SBC2]|nr:hypothetical protein SBC2_85100 [Caballeronia sp. SBC2]